MFESKAGSARRITAFRARDGAVAWTADWPSGESVHSLAIRRDVLVSAGARVSSSGVDGIVLRAYSTSTGRVLWERLQEAWLGFGELALLDDRLVYAGVGRDSVDSVAIDARVVALSLTTGEVLWELNTLRDFESISGATARGGSFSGSGPVVAGGMIYVNSGYGIYNHMPGNLLLAIGVAD